MIGVHGTSSQKVVSKPDSRARQKSTELPNIYNLKNILAYNQEIYEKELQNKAAQKVALPRTRKSEASPVPKLNGTPVK